MEDVKLGRELASLPDTTALAGGADEEIAPVSGNRKSLLVSAAGGATCWIAPRGVTPASGVGIALTATNPVILLRVEDLGKVVCDSWRAFSVGAQTVTVIDASLERQR